MSSKNIEPELLGFPTDFPRPSLLRQYFNTTAAVFVRSELQDMDGREQYISTPLKRRKLIIDEEIELQEIKMSTVAKFKTHEHRKVQFTANPPVEFSTFSSTEYDRRMEGKQSHYGLLLKHLL